MRRALNKINRGDSHISENLESPDSDDKRIRLQRRWRRREATNDSSKHNHVASAKRKTASNHSGGSDIGVNLSNSNDNDDVDSDYALFLNSVTIVDADEEYMGVKNTTDTSFREDGRNSSNNDSAINHSGGSNIGVGVDNDSDEVDSDYALFLNSVTIVDGDEEYMRVKNTTDTSVREDGRNSSRIDTASNHSGGSNVGVGNDNDSDEVDSDYALFLNSVTIVDGDEEYMRVKNTTDTSVREDGRNSSKIDTASNHSGSSNISVGVGNSNDNDEEDPDNTPFLNSVPIVDGDEDYMHVKNTTNTSQVEHRSNSSDSDLIVLESYPTCGNTPFVPSKTYDSSWFGGKMNPKDNMQIPAYDDSDFRRRLVECLDKPYDRREYKELLNRLCNKTKKEDSEDFTTPYHETYPDIAEAITEVAEERPKVLFHLRGFFFWLQNVSHLGSFQPWHDKSCMELLRKM